MFDRNAMSESVGVQLHPDTPTIREVNDGSDVWSVRFPKAATDPEAVLALFISAHPSRSVNAINLRESGKVRIWTIVTKEIRGR